MQQLLTDFKAVAALIVLTLLALITVTLAGVFDGIRESQAAFLGTIAGALAGFLSLLAGALINAHLNRRLILEDEEKRRLSCLLMVHARVRSFVVTMGLLARLVEMTKQIAVENVEAFELTAKSLRPEEFSDLRLIYPDILSDFHDLSAHIEGVRFTVIGPIKLCQVKQGIFEVHGESLEDFSHGVGMLCDLAVNLRRKISDRRGTVDFGPASFADIKPSKLNTVTK